MTQTNTLREKRIIRITNYAVPYTLFVCVIIFGFLLSDRVKTGVIEGMRFAALTVIPIGYPFMIIGDLYRAYGRPERIRPLSYLVTRLLEIPKGGLGAFICGSVAGFPIGAKMASELYTGGVLNKEDAEKIAAISNSPSIPFVLSAVGAAMLSSMKLGIYLLIVIYISVIITSRIYKLQGEYTGFSFHTLEPDFSFTKSVKDAACTSLYIIAFISIFFAIADVLGIIIKSSLLLSILSSFLEVTTAANLASALSVSIYIKLIISAFALSFGGLSVLAQSSIFFKKSGLSVGRYLKIKITEGIIAALTVAISFPALSHIKNFI